MVQAPHFKNLTLRPGREPFFQGRGCGEGKPGRCGEALLGSALARSNSKVIGSAPGRKIPLR